MCYRILALVGVLALAASSAQAQVIVADPDSFADGFAITTPNMTFTDIGFLDVITSFRAPSLASTGTKVFGYGDGTGVAVGYDFAPGELRVDFSAPVRRVSLDFINDDGGFSTDVGRLEAFNSSDVSLGFVDTSVLANNGDRQTLTLASSSGSIAYILAGGSPITFDSIALDHLVVAVPEPGSVVLFAGLAVSGAGFLTRRKRQVV